VSAHLERHREAYYEALSRVRTADDLMGWVLFFLEAVSETAVTGCRKFRQIFALRDEMTAASMGMSNVLLAQRLIRYLYSVPRVTTNQVTVALECPYHTANRLIKALAAANILVPSSDAKRNAVYDFKRYLDIFKG